MVCVVSSYCHDMLIVNEELLVATMSLEGGRIEVNYCTYRVSKFELMKTSVLPVAPHLDRIATVYEASVLEAHSVGMFTRPLKYQSSEVQ